MEQATALQRLASASMLSKASQNLLANDLVSQVVNGQVDPIQAFVQIKAIADVADQFLKNTAIVELTQDAVVAHGKSAEYNGAKVGITYTTRYDYSFSNDTEYNALVKAKEELDTKIKARQMFLKSVNTSMDIVDRESGEARTILAPMPTQSASLRVTFAKQ